MDRYIENLRAKSPLIHNITNMVTINDVANIELACGARPIMAMAPQEMAEVTGICDGLNLNIGTPSQERFDAMRIAADTAQKRGIPITLDLVGVGVSHFRMDFVQELLAEHRIDVIKGNLSEIKALMNHSRCDGGVEATDAATAEQIEKLACEVAERFDCIAVITGETDYVAQVNHVADVTGGHPMMEKVTGTGCQLSGLICSFASANADDMFGAVHTALKCMKQAGERAAVVDIVGSMDVPGSVDAVCSAEITGINISGNATYRDRIIDAVYQMCN